MTEKQETDMERLNGSLMEYKRKISVIMPVYNTAEYLDVSIGSVLGQTIGYADIELIITDDNSDDGRTVEKLKEYEAKYPDNIILILNSENMGPGGCRNTALEYASAEYVFFLDSDDWIDSDAFECLYTAAKEFDADVVEFRHRREFDHAKKVSKGKGDVLGPVQLQVIDNAEKRRKFVLPSESSVVCWDKMYRTDLLKDNEICFAEGISYEEPPFSYMVRFLCKRYLKVVGEFYHYYRRAGSCSDIDNYKKNRFHIVEGYLSLIEELKKKRFDVIYGDEVDFIFWCGAFYLPLFNLASAGTFYSETEFYEIQQKVKEIVPDIINNPYFKSSFKGMELIGKLTYIPKKSVPFEDISEFFQKLTEKQP